jgi:DDB1- and CUL4-associated factor 11
MDDRSWTITDGSLSNDNKWLAYCSLNPIVCLASSDPTTNAPATNLDFSRLYGRSQRYERYFSIYSVRFSRDGREIVAGTGGRSSNEKCIYVFDIEKNQSILRIDGHDDDVNAVCFGDTNSPHILYSGSDDGTIKVWDRRSIAEGRPSGVFLGHTDGLTYVDSKGDGRYVLSNSKDQTTKLWDLRKVLSPEDVEKVDTSSFISGEWHFARDSYRPRSRLHSHDCSVVTFTGHRIERTLIRCHFSPPGSTDGRYVYSGSSDGKIHVWNLDATPKGTINVKTSTTYLKNRERIPDAYWGDISDGAIRTIIRDCSWHPDVPLVAG